MRIRFLQSIASAEGWSYGPGDEADWASDTHARALVAAGIAEVITPAVATETATAERPELALAEHGSAPARRSKSKATARHITPN